MTLYTSTVIHGFSWEDRSGRSGQKSPAKMLWIGGSETGGKDWAAASIDNRRINTLENYVALGATGVRVT